MTKMHPQVCREHPPGKPGFGCRKCIAAAIPTKVNEAAAEVEPRLAFKALERDKRNADSERKIQAKKRARNMAARVRRLEAIALEYRMSHCGHAVPFFDCRSCQHAHDWFKIEAEKPLTSKVDEATL